MCVLNDERVLDLYHTGNEWIHWSNESGYQFDTKYPMMNHWMDSRWMAQMGQMGK